MARVTVEDCLQNVKNRFELVMLAAKRARQLMRGSAEPTVLWENDKPTVVALREIASGHIDFSDAHHVDTTVETTAETIEEAHEESAEAPDTTSTNGETETKNPAELEE